MVEVPYIYQYIRCAGYEPCNLDRYIQQLEDLAGELLRLHLGIDEKMLRQRIASELRSAGCAANHTNVVQVRYYASGEMQIEAVEMLYDGFALRAMRPHAYLTPIDSNLLLRDSSAKEAMVALNRAMGDAIDKDVAVWMDNQGEIIAIDGESVVAVFDDEVRFSREGSGVEFELAHSVASSGRRRITKGAIMVEDLSRATELLFIDYRGITAVAYCEENLYVDFYAENLARQLTENER